MDERFDNMTLQKQLLSKLMPNHDPFYDFPTEKWAGTWYNDIAALRDIFKRSIDLSQPGLIIEVGSFVGESTFFMAQHLKAKGKDAAILCVDTWLGGFDHWTRVPEKLRFVHGRPSLYQQFLGNVVSKGMADLVVPLNLDSSNGARVLKAHGIMAEMIFVDASHEEGDVLRDYEAYWQLLKPGGAFLVDDANGGFPGVYLDLKKFVDSHGLRSRLQMEGEKGLIIKP